MKKAFFCAVFLFAGIFVAHNVLSAELKTGHNIQLSGQTVSENFYTAGGSVVLDNNFEKDVFVAGGKISILGNITGDLFVIGGEIEILGKVLGDVRLMGGSAVIKGEVSGDLLVIGGKITLAPDSHVYGESIFVGGDLIQESALASKSKMLVSNVYLNSTVSGETGVTTQKITFGDHAKISGNFHYFAPDKAEKIDGAETTGVIVFNEIKSIREIGIVKSTILNLIGVWIILKFITTLIVACALTYVFKVFAQHVSNLGISSFPRSFFLGLLVLLIVPIVFSILFISIVAMPIGFLILLVYIFTLIITPAMASIIIGSLVQKMIDKDVEGETKKYISFRTAVIGVVLFTLLQFVPYLGEATRIIFSLAALGAIYRYAHDAIIK